MMSYSVIRNNLGKYDLFEKDSNNTIEIGITQETEARSICRKLNLGSGFAGWTPEFIASKFNKNSV